MDDQGLFDHVSTVLGQNDTHTTEGISIGSILRRLGSQIDDMNHLPDEAFDFEAKEKQSSVWSIDDDAGDVR